MPHEIERVRRSMEADADPEGPFVGDRPLGKLPAPTGRVRDRVGDICGVGRRTVDKIAELYAAAGADPLRVGPIVEAMNRTGKVDGAYRRFRRMQDEDRILSLAPRVGRFRTLVLDPPWEDESVSEGQRPPYATMPLAEIAAVPVPDWAEDGSHIYCHAPGPWVPIAARLIEGWGFSYKQLLTWRKPRWSMGRYFRPTTEYVVFGTRGGLMTRRQDVSTLFEGPVGQHSEKPEEFFQLVRAMSFPPYGEAFQRQARPGFADLFPIAAASEAAE
ncbi:MULTISPECIES: MT-A70 family methyltransferase [unclassified Methylobacterium]|uniref:MT-A70 family methyltransferase n=1 Tax=unclassified Methylobacterium TaxID=2615210 RepID=UPI001FEF93E7|nr:MULTISPECIES: MT-A70 family methyltransferase [unclassified Methylobacterium]